MYFLQILSFLKNYLGAAIIIHWTRHQTPHFPTYAHFSSASPRWKSCHNFSYILKWLSYFKEVGDHTPIFSDAHGMVRATWFDFWAHKQSHTYIVCRQRRRGSLQSRSGYFPCCCKWGLSQTSHFLPKQGAPFGHQPFCAGMRRTPVFLWALGTDALCLKSCRGQSGWRFCSFYIEFFIITLSHLLLFLTS